MIPKIIHYCWFGGNDLTDEVKNISLHGASIVLIIKSLNGMNQILILMKMIMYARLMKLRNGHLLPITFV